MNISISETRTIQTHDVLPLYQANRWTAANKPEELMGALHNSHALVTAWDDDRLIGLGNAISDGFLVVYYPHLLVHPDYQGQGIGQMIVAKMQDKYQHMHMQMLTADREATEFYKKVGFEKAGDTMPMWIYKGKEH